MIQQLNNSKSEFYLDVKKTILSEDIPWFYMPNTTAKEDKNYINIPYYSHSFLLRPEPGNDILYSQPCSNYLNQVQFLLSSIAKENDLVINYFYRINANIVDPIKTDKLTVPHHDHFFDHKNMLVYLTDAGGETVVFNDDGTKEEHHPQEDDVIVFSGLHCHKPPKQKRRIVLVATFI